MRKKLRVQFNPYTYARIAVMKSRLLSKEDYTRLLKMGYHEAFRYLQDSSYRASLEKINPEDPADLERALNEQLLQVVAKLHSICDETMQKVITAYLLRYEFRNIIAIVRSKVARAGREQAEQLFYPSFHHFTKEFLEELLEQKDLESLVEKLPFLNKKEIKQHELFDVEHTIEKHYLETVYHFAEQLRGSGKRLAKFLHQEIDIANIRTILTLHKEHNPEEIAQYLVHPSPLILELSKLESTPEMVKVLHKHRRTLLKGNEENLLEKLDIDLDITLLREEAALFRENMLDATYIIGFLLAKEIEVKNLKVLLKGKLLKIHPEQLERMLVLAP